MATTKSTKVAAKTSRYNELKTMLEERRRELLSEVQGKIRDVRAESGKELEWIKRNRELVMSQLRDVGYIVGTRP